MGKNYLGAIRYVIDNPPEDLIEIMQRDGWIGLFHEDGTSYSFDEHVEWLAPE
ncbi:MAG: hypothetical protein ACRC0L_12605 [Angustibacter sp.]